jgi:DNA-binding Xre family transcriptional regulator
MAGVLKEIKYPNLILEIKRRGETQDDLSKILGITRATFNLKLQGKSEWTISEIEKICEHYDMNYYELFK